MTPLILACTCWPHHDGPGHMLKSLERNSPDTPFFFLPYAAFRNELKSWSEFFPSWARNRTWELRCFLRYPLILEFCKAHGIQSCWSLDWDVLVFCNLEQEAMKWSQFGWSKLPDCLIPSMDELAEFLKWTTVVFEDGTTENIAIRKKHESEPSWTLCDMNLRNYYQEHVLKKGAFDLYEIRDDGAFDSNITCGYYGFTAANNLKVLKWEKGLPYGKTNEGGWARLKTLHCWGPQTHNIKHYVNMK
jgi:hypothetical protein